MPEIKTQVITLISLAASECVHFAIRDVLGAFSFIFTACMSEEYKGDKYYSAIFESSNALLEIVQQFDPIYLSSPTLDEALWNGEKTEGWILEVPSRWPNDPAYVDDIDGAVAVLQGDKA